ncbi:MAG: sensor histidine kinase [Metallibacterium sp.]
MGGLYWRVFGLFWLAMVTVMVASVWITSRVVERDHEMLPSAHQRALAEDIAAATARMVGSHAMPEVRRWLQTQSGGPIHVRIRPLDGATTPRVLAPPPMPGYAAQREATASDGRRFLVDVRWVRPPHPPRPPFRAFWLSFVLLGLLVSTAVALLLARYVALPLKQIRASARQFADGDLGARVGTLRMGRSQEMVALGREFDLMAARIERLIQDHRRLIGDVAHELRSPLARMGVALELSRGETETDEREASAARIARELGRMDRLIGQALDLSRLESGAHGAAETGDLGVIVAARVSDARFEASQRALEITMDTPPPLPIHGELDLIASAVENVLRNALRFAPEGSTVEVQLTRSDRASDPARALLAMRDRGPGVPESDLTHIFEPFYRSADTRQQTGSGSGLGLAIARSSILRAGGSISARNRAGGGLEVLIELPLAPRG